jgi:8-oxo-dGTP diphosphatase
MAHTYEYPRAALTVDCVVLGHERGEEHILLVRRARPPFEGAWALPGGFLDVDETLEQAALRELREETGVVVERAMQLAAFDAIDRDPRERVISVAHLALVADISSHPPRAADDASEAAWFPLAKVPELAFDHAQMITLGWQKAKAWRHG